MGGVYVCQCLSFAASLERPTKESQGQNRNGEIPPSGIVGGLAETSQLLGAGLRPIGKLMELPPDPTEACAPHFYPDLQLRNASPTEVAVGIFVMRRPSLNVGKANALREETGNRTLGATGVGVQTRMEGSAEITSGRTVAQQGLTATCKDLLHKAYKPRQREGEDWRMSS